MIKLLLTIIVAIVLVLILAGISVLFMCLGFWSLLLISLVPLVWLAYSFVDEVILGNG